MLKEITDFKPKTYLAYTTNSSEHCVCDVNGDFATTTYFEDLKQFTLITYNKTEHTDIALCNYFDNTDYELLLARLDIKREPTLIGECIALSQVMNYAKDNLSQMWQLSKKYKQNLMNTKPSDVIEKVIKNFKYNKPIQKEFKYIPPIALSFRTKQLQDIFSEICNSKFMVVNNEIVNEYLPIKFTINGTTLSIGKGGMHTVGNEMSIVSNTEKCIEDYDVKGYYPTLIVNSMEIRDIIDNDEFVEEYAKIRQEREMVRDNKNLSKGLKLILNALTGKFNYKYSKFYNPQLYIQMTLTGQLYLLKLIEELSLANVKVISVNTDGITILNSNKKAVGLIINDWEQLTKTTTTKTQYRFYHAQSVNDYIAIKNDNTIKCIGCFNLQRTWNKNPNNLVLCNALAKYLIEKRSVRNLVTETENKNDFLTIGTSGGKVYKMYHSKTSQTTVTLGARKLPNSLGCKLATDDSWVFDIDYEYYIHSALSKINAVSRISNY